MKDKYINEYINELNSILKFNIELLEKKHQIFLLNNIQALINGRLANDFLCYGNNAAKKIYIENKINEIFIKIDNIQKKRNNLEKMKIGDTVIIKDKLLIISVANNNNFQAYECGSLCVGKEGYISFSGTCGSSFGYEDFYLAGTEKIKVWSFLSGVGANRGVFFMLEVKKYQLNKQQTKG